MLQIDPAILNSKLLYAKLGLNEKTTLYDTLSIFNESSVKEILANNAIQSKSINSGVNVV